VIFKIILLHDKLLKSDIKIADLETTTFPKKKKSVFKLVVINSENKL
jgi:hypothetical protein